MSLRARLFATYFLIVVICLGIVAVSVTVILQGYRDRLAMDSLNAMARPVYVQVRSLIRGEVTFDELWANLEEQADKNNVYILLGDREGNIIRQVTPGQYQKPIETPPGELPHGISKLEQGTFVTSGDQPFLFVAYPLRGLPSEDGISLVNTLILSVPRPGALAIWASLVRPLLLSGVIALCISLIVAILLARSVYRPVYQVTQAVKKISQGKYDQRIPVTGPREIKGLAVSFNQMAEQINGSQQQLRHFVADVSHQLKSPLTSIQGFAQAILDGTAGDDDTRLKAATIINDESTRMRRQVDELLELARMQSGQLKMARESVDVAELLEQCREIFTVQAEEKGVLLKVETENLLTTVGDIDRLEQVLGNLLDNAIKNSPAGGKVGIIGHRIEADSVEIRVVDNGPGIPPEQLPYVFERFYQAGGVRTGVGLGLAIAKEIVIAHEGTIEAKSEPGEATEFIVRLPGSIRASTEPKT
jgi:signal transduction histidine kinase